MNKFPDAVWEPTDFRIDGNGNRINLWSSRKATRADVRRRNDVLESFRRRQNLSSPIDAPFGVGPST